jgi:hypothetical protein
MVTKICPYCGKEKTNNAFYLRMYKKKDGSISTYCSYACKLCIPKIRRKKYHSDENYRRKRLEENRICKMKNREKYLKKRREWRLKNKDRINQKQRDFYKKHKKEIFEKRKKYFQDHKDYYYQKRKEWYERTREELIKLLNGKCVVCGETNKDFLEFDHIKPINSHKRENNLLEIKKHPEKFQLLCANHHRRKTRNESRMS